MRGSTVVHQRLGRAGALLFCRGFLVEKHSTSATKADLGACQQLFCSDFRLDASHGGVDSSWTFARRALHVASQADAAANRTYYKAHEDTYPLDNDARRVADSHQNGYYEKNNLTKSKLSNVHHVNECAAPFLDRLVAAAKQKKAHKENGTDQDPASVFIQQLNKFLHGADLRALETVLDRIGITCEQFVDLFVKLEKIDFQSFLMVTREFERLGINGSIIGSIIKKDVQVLSYSIDEIKSGLRSLKGIMISEDELPPLIQRFPLILKVEFQRKIGWLSKELRAFSSKGSIIRKAVWSHPDRVHSYSKGCAKEVVEFLTGYGFTNERLECMLQKHALMVLTDAKSKLKCNVQFLEDWGLDKELIYNIINRYPNLLSSSLRDNLMAKLEYFKTLGFDETEFSKVVAKYPHIVTASIENKIKPAVGELKSLGLIDEGLKKVVLCKPSLFGYKLGGPISELVKNLDETSYLDGQKVYVRGPLHRKACEDCLVRHGLAPVEAKEVVDKEPGILGYTEEALVLKLETLTRMLGFPIKDVLKVPEYLSFKLRKRIHKRQRVLTYMKSKGLLAHPFTLKQLVLNSNSQFYNTYVKVYAIDKELSKLWLKD